jgi:hypothetical protein
MKLLKFTGGGDSGSVITVFGIKVTLGITNEFIGCIANLNSIWCVEPRNAYPSE